MSYIKPRNTINKGFKNLLEKKLAIADTLDPYSRDTDMIDCDYKGISNIVYDISLNIVSFKYTCENQGIQKALVFCDVDTASELDKALQLIEDSDEDMTQAFTAAFNLCWDYHYPNIFRLIMF